MIAVRNSVTLTLAFSFVLLTSTATAVQDAGKTEGPLVAPPRSDLLALPSLKASPDDLADCFLASAGEANELTEFPQAVETYVAAAWLQKFLDADAPQIAMQDDATADEQRSTPFEDSICAPREALTTWNSLANQMLAPFFGGASADNTTSRRTAMRGVFSWDIDLPGPNGSHLYEKPQNPAMFSADLDIPVPHGSFPAQAVEQGDASPPTVGLSMPGVFSNDLDIPGFEMPSWAREQSPQQDVNASFASEFDAPTLPQTPQKTPAASAPWQNESNEVFQPAAPHEILKKQDANEALGLEQGEAAAELLPILLRQKSALQGTIFNSSEVTQDEAFDAQQSFVERIRELEANNSGMPSADSIDSNFAPPSFVPPAASQYFPQVPPTSFRSPQFQPVQPATFQDVPTEDQYPIPPNSEVWPTPSFTPAPEARTLTPSNAQFAVEVLRNSAEQMEHSANLLERKNMFDQADQLREMAWALRSEARDYVEQQAETSGMPADSPLSLPYSPAPPVTSPWIPGPPATGVYQDYVPVTPSTVPSTTVPSATVAPGSIPPTASLPEGLMPSADSGSGPLQGPPAMGIVPQSTISGPSTPPSGFMPPATVFPPGIPVPSSTQPYVPAQPPVSEPQSPATTLPSATLVPPGSLLPPALQPSVPANQATDNQTPVYQPQQYFRPISWDEGFQPAEKTAEENPFELQLLDCEKTNWAEWKSYCDRWHDCGDLIEIKFNN